MADLSKGFGVEWEKQNNSGFHARWLKSVCIINWEKDVCSKEICFTKAEFGVIMDYPKGCDYEKKRWRYRTRDQNHRYTWAMMLEWKERGLVAEKSTVMINIAIPLGDERQSNFGTTRKEGGSGDFIFKQLHN